MKVLCFFLLGDSLRMVLSLSLKKSLLWSDDFNGLELSTSSWTKEEGSNNRDSAELQEYTEDNVTVENGKLKLTADKYVCEMSDEIFVSGSVSTEGKMSFLYGDVVVRMKFPEDPVGLHPSLSLIPVNDKSAGWPNVGKINVAEAGAGKAVREGTVNRYVTSSVNFKPEGKLEEYKKDLTTTELNKDYHLFRVEWTPKTLTTYVDEIPVLKMNIEEGICKNCKELHMPHFVELSLAVGGKYTYAGTSSDCGSGGCATVAESVTASMPANMLVDYVRIYKNDYTKVFSSTENAAKASSLAELASTPGAVTNEFKTFGQRLLESSPLQSFHLRRSV